MKPKDVYRSKYKKYFHWKTARTNMRRSVEQNCLCGHSHMGIFTVEYLYAHLQLECIGDVSAACLMVQVFSGHVLWNAFRRENHTTVCRQMWKGCVGNLLLIWFNMKTRMHLLCSQNKYQDGYCAARIFWWFALLVSDMQNV